MDDIFSLAVVYMKLPALSHVTKELLRVDTNSAPRGLSRDRCEVDSNMWLELFLREDECGIECNSGNEELFNRHRMEV